jgi:2-C-methyl-D-erythritol 4-phosphate cytidylyltransferase
MKTDAKDTAVWAVVPAAGIGSRMQSEVPKQYLSLNGRKVIEHTLQRLTRHRSIKGVMVALAAHDTEWPKLSLDAATMIHTTTGGKERSDSVLAALHALSALADQNDWVLVHDAARPCLRQCDIDNLLVKLGEHPVGGLLALPVRDTMKRSNDQNQVTATVDRTNLWHALTPQMFRLGFLISALEQSIKMQHSVTDEAQAIELAGHIPLLVEGYADNIKITRPQDLALAELYLKQQKEDEECA